MPNQTVKIVAIAVAVVIVIAVGVIWAVSSSQNAGPRPGVDIPLRGM